jgi:agmatinase
MANTMTIKIPNFCDLPEEYSAFENSAVVVLPVPYDLTSTWMKGADKGPAAIIDASSHLELYDIETDSEVYKKGIFTDSPVDCRTKPEKMVEIVRKKVNSLLDANKFVVLLGGEHSVSIGSAMAYHEHYPDLSVLQFDAHTDLRDEYEGSKCNHACVMARIKEFCPIVQVGIRSMDSSEKPSLDVKRVVFASQFHQNKNQIDKILKGLTNKVYITIDLDVFDPAIMPSTGTPEPGGLFWYDVLEFVQNVIENKNVVGFDIVELCPNKNNKAPDFLTAKLIYKLLSYKFR